VRPQTRAARRQGAGAVVVGIVALVLTGLSLAHLSHGIQIVTLAPAWEAMSLAIGIDFAYVSFEVANLTATEATRRKIACWTNPAIVGTLVGSAVLNAFAFAAPREGWWMLAAGALGVSVPALIFVATKVGSEMWMRRS
jgi:hypothetical protein